MLHDGRRDCGCPICIKMALEILVEEGKLKHGKPRWNGVNWETTYVESDKGREYVEKILFPKFGISVSTPEGKPE